METTKTLMTGINNSYEARVRKICLLGAALLFVIGVGFRIAPLVDHGDRMLWQWPTEDGYLMKTIARNIALGNGMTVSDAEIATNGTQPLTTYMWAGVFWLVDGDKETGVLLIQILQIVLSIVAAGLLFLLARRLLSEYRWGEGAASLAAGLWFASPVVINRTLNGLETGNYMVMILLTLLVWLAGERGAKRPFPGFALGVGALLGLCFLTRIDAVFFIAAVTVWHTLLGFRQQFAELKRRLGESLVMGLTSMVMASPWLAYNKLVFGSFMPISGTAQSASQIGANLAYVPGNLFEYVTLVLPGVIVKSGVRSPQAAIRIG
ncbi:glycosyltransferase family 39 protein [Desulfurivibrio alkaliphilus]|uniref:Glycosyltransferase RgtA/B/C/D-like domain-containing protein n=1 Tax=Desulfurivibrio alkaliphilus (strain DSM 19089 / UNIQEM U267 / AHT2) TaxID=589865 RepID=D6Z4H3_DESAT|nr:glycosyltransferase family 39 protein [Desulfurivibrio alkaliphilus]ADH86448.1 conserved hypothetical protein [Desulfurivibrio alkaliphilus AHT 2]